MKRRWIAFALIACLVAVPVTLCSYNRTETALTSFLCFRQFQTWDETVTVSSGTSVEVEHRHSHDPYWSFGPHFGFGPGDDHFSVAKFLWGGRQWRWATPRDERPIVLRHADGGFWMVTFDRTDMRNIRFRYYFAGESGILEEIGSDAFPKALALQNMWLSKNNGFRNGKPINEHEIVALLDTESSDFQNSLTARIWAELEAGAPYYESEKRSVDPKLLRQYKAKYMNRTQSSQPSATDNPDGAQSRS